MKISKHNKASDQASPLKHRADELKRTRSFHKLLALDGHDVESNGSGWKTCCMFHSDSTPSFSVDPTDTRAKCFGCDFSGDIIDYEVKRTGTGFHEAVESLEGRAPMRDHPLAAEEIDTVDAGPVELTPEQKASAVKFTRNILNSPSVASKIIKGRDVKWNPETITRLAREGTLGWDGSALVFIYPSGLKFRRWPAKEITWQGNAAGGPWRTEVISAAQIVYVAEGETDAISLIDAGIEENGIAVVACPSATGFNIHWGPLFEGKDVMLVFDNDAAGESGTEKAVKVLAPYAKTISRLDWAKMQEEPK